MHLLVYSISSHASSCMRSSSEVWLSSRFEARLGPPHRLNDVDDIHPVDGHGPSTLEVALHGALMSAGDADVVDEQDSAIAKPRLDHEGGAQPLAFSYAVFDVERGVVERADALLPMEPRRDVRLCADFDHGQSQGSGKLSLQQRVELPTEQVGGRRRCDHGWRG